MTVPEVRARALDEFARTIEVIARGRGQADRAATPTTSRSANLAGAVVGVIMAATMPWEEWAQMSPDADMFDRIDAALAQLEAGLPL